ncbi:CTD small phosphatase-like protein-like [Hibiscus syriacus]|uniref:CTD small phosphatase-like protein-like n=1 Tax=Hibiscus syriacus TaxID=106335 RepID=A0A6A2ZXU3_HIBSY|nr:CTD small phosphatase-like protein-like [Hibiscus syriacus]
MRALAAHLNTLLFKRRHWNAQSRNFSSFNGKDEASLEQETERKIGWLLILFFAGTATFVAYQFFPYMGDNLLNQSVSLLHVKDPLFKRMGASRFARFAIDDEAVKALHNAGAISVIKSTPDTFEEAEIGTYKSNLLKRFQDLRCDISSSKVL